MVKVTVIYSMNWQLFRKRANLQHLTEEQKWKIYKRLLEDEELEYQMALLMSDARLNFFQSLGLTPPMPLVGGSDLAAGGGGATGSGNYGPDFFFPIGMERFLAATDSGILLGSIDPGPTPVFVTAVPKREITSVEVTGISGSRTMKLKGFPGRYDTLIQVDEIAGSQYHYSEVYKGDLTTYRSLDEIIEIFNGRPTELIASLRSGGPQSRGTLLTIDPATDSLKRIWDFQIPEGVTTDGRFPWTGALIEHDGYLYGTTRFGRGTPNSGVIYRYGIDDGDYEIVYEFPTSTLTPPGARPEMPLIRLADGRIFGTTVIGGHANNDGTLFEFDPDTHAVTTRAAFNTAVGAVGTLCGGLIEASDGMLYGIALGGANNLGCLVQIDPDTYAMTIKYSFGSATSEPRTSTTGFASPIEINGVLYGVTHQGGTNGTGTIWRYVINTDTFSVRQEFPAVNNSTLNVGATPQSSMFLAPNGNMYGLSFQGTTNNAGALWQYDYTNNTLIPKHALANLTQGRPIGGFTLYNAKMYFVTTGGSNGAIWEYDYTNDTLTVKDNLGGTDGGQSRSTMMVASDGKLYGTTGTGGSSGSTGTIFSWVPSTNTYTVVHNFYNTPASTEPSAPNRLFLASDGELYGTSTGGGSFGVGTIFKYDRFSNVHEKIYNFTTGNPEGNSPFGNLVEVEQSLWGNTSTNSTTAMGSIWSFDLRTETLIHKRAFVESTGGAPRAGMTIFSDGLLYGTTNIGGSSSKGVVYSIDPETSDYEVVFEVGANPLFGDTLASSVIEHEGYIYYAGGSTGGSEQQSNSYLVRYNMSTQAKQSLGTNALAGHGSDCPPMVASDGKIYGASTEDTTGAGFLYRFDPETETMDKIFQFTNSSGTVCFSQFVEHNNKLYGTTTSGGANGHGTAFTWHIYTNTFTKIYDFLSATTGSLAYWGFFKVPATTGLLNAFVDENRISATVDENQTAYTIGDDQIFIFTRTGTLNITYAPPGATMWVLAVGGGGGGAGRGNLSQGGTGGGGAGGFLEYTAHPVSAGQYTITIGAGGIGGGSGLNGGHGGNTTGLGLTAIGGGGGKTNGGAAMPDADGGSGGGGTGGVVSNVSLLGGFGTPGQGFAGGNFNSSNIASEHGGAGGGGASEPGEDAGFDNVDGDGGDGGDGKASDITGVTAYYAGGGGGGSYWINTQISNGELFANNGTTTYNITVSLTPLQPFSIFIYDTNFTDFMSDDGEGNLVPNSNPESFGTVNYETGEISVTWGVAPESDIWVDYVYLEDLGDADPIGGLGGLGGGGNGFNNTTQAYPTAGTANTGGGGGGGSPFATSGAAGGSGVFIVRFKYR